MADEVTGLASVLGERLDVRDEVIRHGERLRQTATREEMNAGDFRVLKDVSDMLDRSTQAHNQYVRERVRESALETKNTMQEMEGRLTSAISSLGSSIAALATPQQPAPTHEKGRGMHPLLPATGGFGTGVAVLYLILAFFNIVPRP